MKKILKILLNNFDRYMIEILLSWAVPFSLTLNCCKDTQRHQKNYLIRKKQYFALIVSYLSKLIFWMFVIFLLWVFTYLCRKINIFIFGKPTLHFCGRKECILKNAFLVMRTYNRPPPSNLPFIRTKNWIFILNNINISKIFWSQSAIIS